MESPENEEKHELDAPQAHNPPAPLHESFDIPSTVDPSYLISMIRRLIPSDVKVSEYSAERCSVTDKMKAEGGNTDVCLVGGDKEMHYFDEHDETKPTIDNDADQDSSRRRNGNEAQGGSEVEDIWEECGCVLWDLSASEEYAQFMVQNLILEVLLANLMVSQSSRVSEICLGILGNIACHECLQENIGCTNGLVQVIVGQLLVDDVPILCETCRVISSCLRGIGSVTFAEALQLETLISRILWIAENTLNSELLLKIVELLLAILESDSRALSILLPPLINLDLSSLLVKLLDLEIGKLRERLLEKYDVLDMILRTIEALSTIDVHSREICLNRRLWPLVKEMVESPDKLEGLFDVLPFAAGDTEAKTAVWSVIARSLTLFQEKEIPAPTLHSFVAALLSKTELIEDELLECPRRPSSMKTTDPRPAAVKRITDLLLQWRSLHAAREEEATAAACAPVTVNHDGVANLLRVCNKFFK